MKKLLFITIAILIVGCKKDDNNSLHFDFKIIRSIYSYDPRFDSIPRFRDSLIYYYDKNRKLLQVDKCYSKDDISVQKVEYSGNVIKTYYCDFILNSNNQIIEQNYRYSDSKIYFAYSDNFLTCLQTVTQDAISEEEFYFYVSNNIVIDSTVIYNSAFEKSITVNNSIFCDTFSSDYLINYFGLYEYPIKNKNLVREIHSKYYSINNNNIIESSGLKYIFDYILTDGEIVQKEKFINVNNNEIIEISINKYRIIK